MSLIFPFVILADRSAQRWLLPSPTFHLQKEARAAVQRPLRPFPSSPATKEARVSISAFHQLPRLEGCEVELSDHSFLGA